MKKIISLLLICCMAMVSCEKLKKPIDNGTFEGVFRVSYSDTSLSSPVKLELKNGSYDCDGNSDRIPPDCSGTFSADSDHITFKNEGFYTADFDWNLILKGEYDYTYDGKNLYIYAAKNDVGFYELILVKK